MSAPQEGVTPAVQSKTAPLDGANEDVIGVGYVETRAGDEDVLGRKAGYVVPVEKRKPIVTEWSGLDDWKNAPPDYDTFMRQYMQYTRVLCIRAQVFLVDVEDMSQMLLTRFMERDSLGVFTPNWGSQSEDRKSNFRSYYSRFVATYLKGYRRNEAKYRTRHLAILDAPVDEDGTTWADLKAPAHEDNLFSVEFAQVVESVRAQHVVSDEVLDAVLTLGSQAKIVKQAELAEVLGCDNRTAKAALGSVRAALMDCMAD